MCGVWVGGLEAMRHRTDRCLFIVFVGHSACVFNSAHESIRMELACWLMPGAMGCS